MNEENEDVTALSGTLSEAGHEYRARVYYADTDFSGAVYHARYLEFFERGRSDFLRLVGIHHTELMAGKTGEPVYWVVRRMEIDFRSPARIDDVLTISTRVVDAGGARIRMQQALSRDGTLLVSATVEAALINDAGKPRRFPREWLPLFRVQDENGRKSGKMS